MGRTAWVASALLVALLIAGGTAAWRYQATRPGSLSLRFEAMTSGEPLVLDEFRYANPGGTGRVRIRDVQFYLSNITLEGSSGDYVEPASYHLVRFDNAERAFTLVLNDVPRHDYQRISFSIGVDAAANASLDAVGDLDPNGRMAWNWEVGYKFVLFEGTLQFDATETPLVYHVGFADNLARLDFDAGTLFAARRDEQRVYRVDVMRLFGGNSPIDMAALPSVKFDRADAKRIAANFAAMITAAPTP